MKKTTEQSSGFENLDALDITELTRLMNTFDAQVHAAVQEQIPDITTCITAVVDKMKNGGRLFYIGAGTSGRLGILDASECPPTFGVPHNMVIGIIAGGDQAIRKAVEFAEDDTQQAWKDLQKHNITPNDYVIGIAASGSTPYVIGGLKDCKKHGIQTGCITCNAHSELAQVAHTPISINVGPEFITGSTRLKSGTAQKMVLNMISTICMIKLGKVVGNKMVDMQLSNNKLWDRGTQMILADFPKLNEEEARAVLAEHGSVRKALVYLNSKK